MIPTGQILPLGWSQIQQYKSTMLLYVDFDDVWEQYGPRSELNSEVFMETVKGRRTDGTTKRKFIACNELIDSAASKVVADPGRAIHLPWVPGALGAESKTLLMLAHAYGALGVASKDRFSGRVYKCYYSRESTGNWFAEVWPLWKVTLWFLIVAFFAAGFYSERSGAGAFLVGVVAIAVFGLRAVLALKHSVIAGRLSPHLYARESFPLMAAGAVIGVIMLEWAFVLPWNGGRVFQAFFGLVGLLGMPYGIVDFVYRILKVAFTEAMFAGFSVLSYQALAVGMMRGWLQTAFNAGLVFSEPEAGTWFHKVRHGYANRSAGFFMAGFMLTACCGLVLPFLR